MKKIGKIKLNVFYPELKPFNLDNRILNEVVSNKNFKNQYKNIIKPFINFLEEFKSDAEKYGRNVDSSTIKHHVIAILELSKQNNAKKYADFVKEEGLGDQVINNFEVLNDKQFNELYNLIGNRIFNENIGQIVNSGYAERLIQAIKTIPQLPLDQLIPEIFKDKVWNTINENFVIGNTPIFNLFNSKNSMEILDNIISQDLFLGFKYTYENIPNGRSFIERILTCKPNAALLQPFSMEFINNVGIDALTILYSSTLQSFENEKACKNIFKIASFGNYDLIRDIVHLEKYNFNFENISEEDMKKPFIEISSQRYIKSEILLNKYFGIEKENINDLKLFLDSINQVSPLPKSFMEKYGDILDLLNQIFTATDEQIINLSHQIDINKKDEYKKLIRQCEQDGNEILKEKFVNDLKEKNNQIVENAEHKTLLVGQKNVDIYELSGEPFTMLVHHIVDNKHSSNNSYVNQIIDNPNSWNEINHGNKHISTSLISDNYIMLYGGPAGFGTLIFGFYDLSKNILKLTDVQDVGIDRTAPTDMDYSNRITPREVNTITAVDNLMSHTIQKNVGRKYGEWNEVVLFRSDPVSGQKIKPDYIVCFDNLNEQSLTAAAEFNIPIYKVNTKFYKNLYQVQELPEQLMTDQITEENQQTSLKR